MKRFLATISIAITFSVMFSSTSFADWKKMGENVDGATFYVDFERIRKHDGYVYYWELGDYLKPDEYGNLSGRAYNQGDCELFRSKILSFSFHKERMGRGTGDTLTPKNPEWVYPPPDSTIEYILKSVCEYAK